MVSSSHCNPAIPLLQSIEKSGPKDYFHHSNRARNIVKKIRVQRRHDKLQVRFSERKSEGSWKRNGFFAPRFVLAFFP